MTTPRLELYCLTWHPRAAKAIIPAKLGGVELKLHEVQWPTENRTPEFLKLSPAGKARTTSLLAQPLDICHKRSRAFVLLLFLAHRMLLSVMLLFWADSGAQDGVRLDLRVQCHREA